MSMEAKARHLYFKIMTGDEVGTPNIWLLRDALAEAHREGMEAAAKMCGGKCQCPLTRDCVCGAGASAAAIRETIKGGSK